MEANQIVWRVTLGSVKAFGPYQSNSSNKKTKRLRDFCDLLCELHVGKRYPTPENDNFERASFGCNSLFGFSSRAQLRNWFSLEERISLAAHGFSLFRVEVAELSGQGNKQIAFRKESIVSVRKMPIVRFPVEACTKKKPCPVCDTWLVC